MTRNFDEFADSGIELDEPDRPARTAEEEDHTDPWAFAGAEADAPVNPEDGDGVA